MSEEGDLLTRKRLDLINKVLLSERVDLRNLHTLSRIQGGFVDNRVRARAWPKLLAVNRYNIVDFRSFIDPHKDDAQLRCDIERSLWNYDATKEWDDSLREVRRNSLSNIITAILCRNPSLHYYQGFHDVVGVFLLVLEDDHLAFALAEVASTSFFQDYMTPDFEVVSKIMGLIMVLIKATDAKLYAHLDEAGVQPFFATSWLITWFSHDVKKINDVARIFDALLCSHPLFPLYICAAYVVLLRDEILACECDFASLHNLIVHAPERSFCFEDILLAADDMISAIGPTKLFLLADDSIKELVQDGMVGCFKQPEHYSRYVDSDWKLLQSMEMYPLSAAVSNVTPIDMYVSTYSTAPPSLVVDKYALSQWGWKRYFTNVPDHVRRNVSTGSKTSSSTGTEGGDDSSRGDKERTITTEKKSSSAAAWKNNSSSQSESNNDKSSIKNNNSSNNRRRISGALIVAVVAVVVGSLYAHYAISPPVIGTGTGTGILSFSVPFADSMSVLISSLIKTARDSSHG